MNPNEIQVPQPTAPAKTSKRTKLALWLMIGPTALLIVTFVLYAVIGLATGSTAAPAAEPVTITEGIQSDAAVPESLFGETSPAETAGNVILFIVGTISVITFLPGLIIGIVLLATRKQ